MLVIISHHFDQFYKWRILQFADHFGDDFAAYQHLAMHLLNAGATLRWLKYNKLDSPNRQSHVSVKNRKRKFKYQNFLKFTMYSII